MNTNSHIDVDSSNLSHKSDSINHINPQLHTAVSVVRPSVRDSTHTVVTVPQQLDTETVVLVSQLVKPGKQFIEKTDEFLSSTLSRELGEPTDVSKQNTHILVPLDINLVELSVRGLPGNVRLHLHGDMSG